MNTLKMEQRIDRRHRLGQENDVLSLAFINQCSLSDVRKTELTSKWMLPASMWVATTPRNPGTVSVQTPDRWRRSPGA
nr:hypothetical protein [uncultured Oscillibacter sp.]